MKLFFKLAMIVFFIAKCAMTPTKPDKLNLNANLASSWSKYQGKMHWDDAKGICESKGMRLPSLEEMNTAARSGLFQDWQADVKGDRYAFFWVYEKYPNGMVLVVSLFGGVTDMPRKVYDGQHFRCIRDESKLSVHKNSKPTPPNWSEYMGRMGWEEAKNKCASLKMTLPTMNELVDIFNAEVGKSWLKDGAFYWSSQEATPEGKFARAHDVNMLNGKVGAFSIKSDSINHVRCVKN